MPSYETPEPILANIEPVIGNVRIVASDRTDTVVDVRPTDERNSSDVRAAAQTRVEFSGGTLSVRGQKMNLFDFSNKTRSIDVTVELPSGSRLDGGNSVGDLHGTGRLGACRFKTSVGNIQLDHTGELTLHTSTGNVIVEQVAGNAEVSTSSGRVDIGAVTGAATVKNSNGPTTIGSAGGSARVRAANGEITVEHAENAVDAKTANGGIRVLDAVRGVLTLETALGDIEIGVRAGSAAWLDVRTSFGRVHKELEAAQAPDAATDTLEVRASTHYGDITVRRS